jgi:short-subunit dehydrogenase
VIFKSTEYLESYKATDTWAVVTGGSDGIGFEYCEYLAREHGYNICIIARNEDKMHKCCEMLRAKNPKIKAKYIIADFSKLSSINDYKKLVMFNLTDIDIGIVILNAGVLAIGSFSKQSKESV